MAIRNNVSLIGNLGAAPKVTTLESGTTITEFSLATNEYFRDRDGNRQTRTMWHTVKAFGKAAVTLGQYLESGSQVAIDGRLSYRKWIDRYEQTRTSTEIIVDDFTFLSTRSTAAPTYAERPASAAVAAEPAPSAVAYAPEESDELPF